MFSTPVLYLLHVNRGSAVDLYLACCDELATWAEHFRIPSVAQTETALWTLSEIMKDTARGDAAVALKAFAGDLWIQRRHAAHVIGPFLREHGRLELALILLDADVRLAGKIAADEYERLLGVASERFCRRSLANKPGAAERLIDKLLQKKKITAVEAAELQQIWETRNSAVHPRQPVPTREAVEIMIAPAWRAICSDRLPARSRRDC